MALKTCECCGQVLPDQWELVAARAELSKLQSQLFQLIARSAGRPVRWALVIEEIYGDRPDGGPLDPRATLAVTAWNANKRLAKMGFKIAGKSTGPGKGAGLRLVNL